MNDRIPGTTWDNPIWYRGFRIYVANHCFVNYEYVHDDYDGAEARLDRPGPAWQDGEAGRDQIG